VCDYFLSLVVAVSDDVAGLLVADWEEEEVVVGAATVALEVEVLLFGEAEELAFGDFCPELLEVWLLLFDGCVSTWSIAFDRTSNGEDV
jgi:hypothetical protein